MEGEFFVLVIIDNPDYLPRLSIKLRNNIVFPLDPISIGCFCGLKNVSFLSPGERMPGRDNTLQEQKSGFFKTF